MTTTSPGFEYDVFLSHSSADKDAVEIIGQELRGHGLEPFLDKWHLVPGRNSQPPLEEAIQKSATVAVFIGPSGFGAWHLQEQQLALSDPHKRVIPVLLPGGRKEQVQGFLRLKTWVDLSADRRDLSRLIAGVRGVPPDRLDLPTGASAHTERGLVTRAMQIDRENQWKYLVQAHCHRHVLFFLSGSRRQSLRLFIDRMRYDLSRAVGRSQTVVQVEPVAYAGDEGPISGVEWLRRAAEATERQLKISGSPPVKTLVRAAEHEDLLLVVGPLRLQTLVERAEIRTGLRELVEDELCDVMEDHAQGVAVAGLRVVVYVQPSEPKCDEEDKVLNELKKVAREVSKKCRARMREAVPFIQPLPEARLPDWDQHIEPFLFAEHASDRVFEVARKVYEKLKKPDSELTFAAFADILEHELIAL